MSSDSARKQKKTKDRDNRIKKRNLEKKMKKNNGITAEDKKTGSYKLYAMGVIILLASFFIFYNMR